MNNLGNESIRIGSLKKDLSERQKPVMTLDPTIAIGFPPRSAKAIEMTGFVAMLALIYSVFAVGLSYVKETSVAPYLSIPFFALLTLIYNLFIKQSPLDKKIKL